MLAKRRLIFLHWWHHATVLLYCWHSYGTQIATGLWFATMNYFVHALMYAYYGCMGVERLRPRGLPATSPAKTRCQAKMTIPSRTEEEPALTPPRPPTSS